MQFLDVNLIRKHSLFIRQSQYGILLLIVLGFALRVNWLDARTLFGDEYNSIIEAETIGKNMQALIFSGLLRSWLMVGTEDFMVRFPSVFFGVLAIPAAFRFGRSARNTSVGLVLALMMTVSSFAIEYSQITRFYSLFLFSSILSLAYFIEFRQRPGKQRFLSWIALTALTLLSHLFGVFVFLGELVVLWLDTASGRRKWIQGFTLVCLVAFLAVILPLFVNSDTFSQLERVIGGQATPNLNQSRGLSLANLAKVPLTYYFFGMGQSFYPLDLPLALVGVLLFLCAGVLGLIAIRSSSTILLTTLVLLGLVPFVFLVIDPAAPAFSETAAPRHVIAALPVLLLLVAIGVAHFRYGKVLLAGIVLIQLYGLGQYYWGDWSYTIPMQVNWKNLETQLGSPDNTLLLYDGRSKDAVERYFSRWRTEDFWEYRDSTKINDLDKFERIILVTNDYREGTRQEIDHFLEGMESRWEVERGIVRYPVFANVFRQKPQSTIDQFSINPLTGQLRQPVEIYGLEFQELNLPLTSNLSGAPYSVEGNFALPGVRKEKERILPIDSDAAWRGIILATNLNGVMDLHAGEPVAEVTIRMADGTIQVLPLRLGMEVRPWNAPCGQEQNCQMLWSWHKRSALVGQRAYPEAWTDFEAGIFLTRFTFAHPGRIRELAFRYLAPVGQLNIWAIAFD